MDSEKADLITTLHALTSRPEASEEALSLNHWQAEDWSRLLAESKTTVLHPGEMLFKRGDDNSDLFFLVAGSLEVSVLSRFAFRRLVDTAPSQACDLLLALARIIATRLRRAHGD